ncbi:MAG: alpha-L-fucosidase [Planctomycetota bacterium]
MSATSVPDLSAAARRFTPDRTTWFAEARFGMFIHWGLYALLGRGEWAMSRECIPADEYASLQDRFTAEDYDPRRWARLAVEAGMKYAVLTSKHHEGFCLWDSKACSFNAVNSAAQRDLFAEYVEAFRDEGLKVGVYYSLGDWKHPDWKRGYEGDDAARQRFMDYTAELLHELMTGYGPLDLLFYDLPQNYSSNEWRSVELNAMVRELQPHILVNNRALTTEDYATPEQHATASPPGRLWESCMTLNDNWGYAPHDHNFKTPRQVARTLGWIASGGGNLLLNVGPDPAGRIPEPSRQVLGEVGRWLDLHGEAIYASQRHAMSWNSFGPVSARGHDLYLHLASYFGSTLHVGALTNQVKSATLLTTGQTLDFEQIGDRLTLTGLPDANPDPTAVQIPIVKLELDGPPRQDFTPQLGTADIFPVFPV